MRWVPALAMMLVSLLSYVDRNALALLAPTILAENHLTDEQYGWIISSFSVAYMIGNPTWGRLLDRVGLRLGMLVAVSLWTASSASHALCAGLLSFAVARAALGFGEGATFPGGLRTVTQTLAPHQRSRGTALAYSGGSLGAILTPLVVTPVALAWGWRAAFLCTGLLGLAWLGLWLRVGATPAVREPPHLEASAEGDRPHLSDARVWAFMSLYALGAVPLGFVMYAAPIYFSQALHQGQAWLGHWLWVPPLGWEVGYFAWGWLTDRGLPVPRAVAILAVLSLPLALVPYGGDAGGVLAALFFAMFVASGFVITGLSLAGRTFSPAHSGFIAGLGAGSWSAVVAVLMPLFGRLFDRHAYGAAFAVAAALPCLGAFGWRLLSSSRGTAPNAALS
jgi:ACS family hexuronate transporter-like MFS transporter